MAVPMNMMARKSRKSPTSVAREHSGEQHKHDRERAKPQKPRHKHDRRLGGREARPSLELAPSIAAEGVTSPSWTSLVNISGAAAGLDRQTGAPCRRRKV